MDANVLLAGGMTLVSAVSFIVATTVPVNVTRGDLKECKRELADFKKDVSGFKKDVDTRFSTLDDSVNARPGRLEVGAAEMKNPGASAWVSSLEWSLSRRRSL